MKLNKLMSSVLAIALAAPYTVVSTSAAETFSSAEDLITDAVNVALAGITSSAMNNGIAYMQSKLSVSGDAVLYDGNTIGYWYSDSSDTLYADSTKTEKLIAPTTDGYTVDPDTLKPILIDINSKLKDVYTPTSDDWSKLIGRYDVALGDVTIPADQWVETNYYWDRAMSSTIYSNMSPVNMNDIAGINVSNIGKPYKGNAIITAAYVIDSDNNLFIQSTQAMIALGDIQSSGDDYWGYAVSDTGNVAQSGALKTFESGSACRSTTCTNLKIGLVGGFARNTNTDVRIVASARVCNDTDSSRGHMTANTGLLYRPDGSGTKLTLAIDGDGNDNIKKTGFFWLTADQMGISDWDTFHAKSLTILRSAACSKTVVGNTKLSKRITKLASLADSDILSVTSAGWFVNGTENFDTLFGVQQLTNAGDTADINAVAEIEPLTFNVVVPTTLPLYIDSAGVVTTASNATVTNKSNAAVKLTDIDIIAKDDSGWTLVASDPSPVRDAQEFTFTTSLVKDTVLQKDEVHHFTYNAELSPITSGADALDLATVSVTVDWAD